MTAALARTAALRQLIRSPETSFLLEAHSGISARIAAEAGFEGIWASGLGISAQCGVRDNNELSWTQVLEILAYMTDATTIPILLDADTGYGDFNNVRRLVRKVEQCGGAGICIEDKLFPKTNSFIRGERQGLADVDEFCGKIKAAKDSQADADFCLVARVEALIAGFGMSEALRRAEAYRAAGADAILIHSKLPRADEVVEFATEWGNRLPLLIVPTTYYSTPTDVFRRLGISVVIWGNPLIRASAIAMQRVASAIYASQSLTEVDGSIAPVSEIFRLQGSDELLEAERRYGKGAQAPAAIILAASRGAGLEAVTEERPKVMLPVAGRPLLRRLVDKFKAAGMNEIQVVAGYRADAIDVPGVQIVRNPRYATSGELASFDCAIESMGPDTLLLYGDLLFRGYILHDLLASSGELVLVVDSAPPPEHANQNDLAYCSAPDDRALYRKDVAVQHVSGDRAWQGRAPDGRWIGLARVRGEACRWVRDALAELRTQPDFDHRTVPDLFNHLIERGNPLKALYIHGHWQDVNDLHDLERANAFAQGDLD